MPAPPTPPPINFTDPTITGMLRVETATDWDLRDLLADMRGAGIPRDRIVKADGTAEVHLDGLPLTAAVVVQRKVAARARELANFDKSMGQEVKERIKWTWLGTEPYDIPTLANSSTPAEDLKLFERLHRGTFLSPTEWQRVLYLLVEEPTQPVKQGRKTVGVRLDLGSGPRDYTFTELIKHPWIQEQVLQQLGKSDTPESPAGPRDRNRFKDFTIRTCPVCFRDIKATRGVMADHGYTLARDWGRRSGGCEGVGELPWEVSTAGAVKYVEALEEYEASLVRQLDDLNSGRVQQLTVREQVGRKLQDVAITPEDPRWAAALKNAQNRVDYELSKVRGKSFGSLFWFRWAIVTWAGPYPADEPAVGAPLGTPTAVPWPPPGRGGPSGSPRPSAPSAPPAEVPMPSKPPTSQERASLDGEAAEFLAFMSRQPRFTALHTFLSSEVEGRKMLHAFLQDRRVSAARPPSAQPPAPPVPSASPPPSTKPSGWLSPAAQWMREGWDDVHYGEYTPEALSYGSVKKVVSRAFVEFDNAMQGKTTLAERLHAIAAVSSWLEAMRPDLADAVQERAQELIAFEHKTYNRVIADIEQAVRTWTAEQFTNARAAVAAGDTWRAEQVLNNIAHVLYRPVSDLSWLDEIRVDYSKADPGELPGRAEPTEPALVQLRAAMWADVLNDHHALCQQVGCAPLPYFPVPSNQLGMFGHRPAPAPQTVGYRRGREVVRVQNFGEARALADAGAPFRAPHYSVGAKALVSEAVDQAQGGVLFLDELDRFGLEPLRALNEALRHHPSVLIAYTAESGPALNERLPLIGVAVPTPAVPVFTPELSPSARPPSAQPPSARPPSGRSDAAVRDLAVRLATDVLGGPIPLQPEKDPYCLTYPETSVDTAVSQLAARYNTTLEMLGQALDMLVAADPRTGRESSVHKNRPVDLLSPDESGNDWTREGVLNAFAGYPTHAPRAYTSDWAVGALDVLDLRGGRYLKEKEALRNRHDVPTALHRALEQISPVSAAMVARDPFYGPWAFEAYRALQLVRRVVAERMDVDERYRHKYAYTPEQLAEAEAWWAQIEPHADPTTQYLRGSVGKAVFHCGPDNADIYRRSAYAVRWFVPRYATAYGQDVPMPDARSAYGTARPALGDWLLAHERNLPVPGLWPGMGDDDSGKRLVLQIAGHHYEPNDYPTFDGPFSDQRLLDWLRGATGNQYGDNPWTLTWEGSSSLRLTYQLAPSIPAFTYLARAPGAGKRDLLRRLGHDERLWESYRAYWNAQYNKSVTADILAGADMDKNYWAERFERLSRAEDVREQPASPQAAADLVALPPLHPVTTWAEDYGKSTAKGIPKTVAYGHKLAIRHMENPVALASMKAAGWQILPPKGGTSYVHGYHVSNARVPAVNQRIAVPGLAPTDEDFKFWAAQQVMLFEAEGKQSAGQRLDPTTAWVYRARAPGTGRPLLRWFTGVGYMSWERGPSGWELRREHMDAPK